MSSEEDPVAWLRAQIEERKAAAEAATPGPWEPEGDDPTDDEVYTGGDDDASFGWRLAICRGPRSHENMLHIAANDPRDTIARCEAELAILDEHDESDTPEELRHGHWEGHGSNERWIRDEPNDCPVCREESPCRTVRLLAGGYKYRPGFPAAFAAKTPG